MAIADELIALLGFELTGEDAAKRYQNTLNRLEKSAERVGAAIGTTLKLGMVAAAGATALLGRSVINTTAQFETYQATLETIEGSAEKAKQSLSWIAEFAKTTPYDIAQVTGSFVKLKAYGIDPIADDALRILGDTGAAMGKTLDQSVEAFADAATGEFERLKEFGIKAKTEGDNVTFSWTKNGQELTKTVKKSSTEIRSFLLDTMGDRFAGAMDRQSRTWAGMISNLGDTWTGFQRKIGEAGFFDNVSGKLQALLTLLDRLDKEGKLDEWATSLSNSLSAVADVLWAVGSRIAENAAFIAENFDAIQGPVMVLGAAIAFLLVRAFPLISVLGFLALVTDDFLAYLQGGESIIGDFIAKIQELTGVSEGVAQALAGLGGVVLMALGTAFLVAPGTVIKTFGMLIVRGLLALAPMIASAAAGAFALLSNPIGWAIILGGAAAGLIWYFWDDLKAAWARGEALVSDLGNQMKNWFLSIDWTGLGVSIMTGIWDGMKSMGAAIQSWIASLIPDWAKGWFTGDGPPPAAGADVDKFGANFLANQEKVDASGAATVTDNRQDNRQFPQNNNIVVNQTVTQAAAAPGAAAQATGTAVQQSVAGQRSQIETEPTF